MAITTKYFIKGLQLRPTTDETGLADGNLLVNLTDKKFKAYLDGALREVITNNQIQTLTNKTIDAASNTISNINTTHLAAGVLDTDISAVSGADDTIPSAKAVKTYVDTRIQSKDEASEITYSNVSSGLTATNVQTAIDEVESRLDTAESNISIGSTNLSNHLNDTVDAHDASAISNIPQGNLAATDVQSALNELQSDIDSRVSSTDLSTHASTSSGVHGVTGSLVGTTDTQTLTNKWLSDSTTAIVDAVDTSKKLLFDIAGNPTSNTTLQTSQTVSRTIVLPDADTTLVGTNATQTLTNKTITGASIQSPSRLDMKQDTKANLTTYASTAANGQLVFATDTLETFVIKNNALSAVGGGGGVGSVDYLNVDQADLSALTDYTQTNLEIVESPSILLHGTKSFRLQHSTSIKSFKKIIAVDRKFRGKNMTVNLDVMSSATSGNLNILFYDETNAANLAVSQVIATNSQAITGTAVSTATLSGLSQSDFNKLKVGMLITGANIPVGTTITALNTSALTATMSASSTGTASSIRISDLPAKKTFSFDVPANCASLSWTISSVVEANTESYIDDIVVQLTSQALSSTSVSVPNVTSWQAYTPTFQGFGTPTSVEFEYRQVGENYEIRGKFTTGTTTAVEARVGLPNGATSANTSAIPSLSVIGVGHTPAVTSAGFVNTVPVLIEPNVTYVTFQNAGTSTLGKANANNIAGTGAAFSFSASVPIANLTSTTSTTIPLTTAQLVQQSDSVLKMNTVLGYGSTGTKILRFSNIEQSLGSAIQYISDAVNGDRFIAQEAGLYNLSLSWSASVASGFGLSKNASSLTTNLNSLAESEKLTFAVLSTGNQSAEASCEVYLNVGDIVRAHTDGAAVGTNVSKLSIAYKGSLKQLNPSTDSKITIPTHQLRFEGASARGSTDTAIVKFDTQAITQGDAWTVTNTAANGTVVTIKKAGTLNLSTTVYTGGVGSLALTKNQQTLTGIPNNSEKLNAASNASGYGTTVSWSGSVNVGDIIRVAMDVALTSSVSNSFTLSLTETSIPANFSNVLPQWSQSDSSVRLQNYNTKGSTYTSAIRLTNTLENAGTAISFTDSATLGTYLTINEDGLYHIHSSISYTNATAGTAVAAITKNLTSSQSSSVSTNRLDFCTAYFNNGQNTNTVCTYFGLLNKGDTIFFLSDSATIDTASPDRTYVHAVKVGKPNLSSVDVTPFVNMKTTDVEAIEALTATSTFGSTNTGVPVLNITKNTNLGVIRVDSSAANGTSFVALKDCELKLSTTMWGSASAGSYYITKNATILTATSPDGVVNYATTAGNGFGTPSSVNLKLVAGDVIRIQRSSTVMTNCGATTITAVADNNTTAAPVQTVSSDTIPFVFKATAIDPAVDPIGTFNTYTYAINTNTATIAGTAPTQTTSSMNINGIQVFARAYNAASTAASPARVDIFIGKGLKSKQVDAYGALAKLSPFSYDSIIDGAFNAWYGTNVAYNETSGILTISGGINGGSVTNRQLGVDIATSGVYSSGYFVFNASKSPSLVTIPNLVPRIATLSDVKASGTQSGSATAGTFNTRTLNTIEDPTGIVTSLASNQFTLSQGEYYIESTAPSYNPAAAHRGKLRIRNITDGTTSIIGESDYTITNGGLVSHLRGRVSISSSKVFELQHFLSTVSGTQMLGVESSSGENEVYAQVKITKIK